MHCTNYLNSPIVLCGMGARKKISPSDLKASKRAKRFEEKKINLAMIFLNRQLEVSLVTSQIRGRYFLLRGVVSFQSVQQINDGVGTPYLARSLREDSHKRTDVFHDTNFYLKH